jgi:hypothetical protein
MARRKSRKKAATASDESWPGSEAFDGLAPAPRPVSARLVLQLLTPPVAVVGSLLVGLAMLFLPALLAEPGPLITFGPSRWARASGELKGVARRSERRPGGPRQAPRFVAFYEYSYTFTLPDGTTRSGQSRSSEERYRMPRRARRGQPAAPPTVTVEYDPARPEVNRLEGTSAALPVSPAVPLLGMAVVVGLLVAVGVGSGLRRVRLLRRGEPGWAWLTSCLIQEGKRSVALPLEDYKERLREQRRQWRESAHNPWAVGCFWVAGLVSALGASIFLGIAGALAVQIGFGPPGGSTPPIAWGAGGVAVVVSLVVLVGVPIARARRRWLAHAAAKDGDAGSYPLPRVSCEYSFDDPAGATHTGRVRIRFAALDEEEPPRPLVYDPARPRRLLLLDGLSHRPVIRGDDGWDTTCQVGPIVRAVVLLVGLVLLPLLGLLRVVA